MTGLYVLNYNHFATIFYFDDKKQKIFTLIIVYADLASVFKTIKSYVLFEFSNFEHNKHSVYITIGIFM